MNFRILRAILGKDLLSLLPLTLGITALFVGDVVITQFELIAQWPQE